MDSRDTPSDVDAADWRLLRTLFPADEDFRHKMGIQRREPSEFYAPTVAGPAIHEQKAAILSDHFSLHTLMSVEGSAALREFAAALGHGDCAGDGGSDFDGAAAIRELTLRIEPDFLLLTPPNWTLAAASVCFPSRWSLEGKLHHALPDLHAPVPGLNAQLGRKIATFFDRMVAGEGWSRANWGLSASTARNQHPSRPLPALTAATPPEEIFLRIEDQHLLKLPRTGAVAFGIRILSFALGEATRDPAVRAGLQKKLRTMPSEVTDYKGLTQLLVGIA